MKRGLLLCASAFVAGCAAAFGQTDGFHAQLQEGCSTEDRCDRLVAEAKRRVGACKDNTVGYLRCGDARGELEAAQTLATGVRERSEKRIKATTDAERAGQSEKRVAELERDLEAARSKAAAASATIQALTKDYSNLQRSLETERLRADTCTTAMEAAKPQTPSSRPAATPAAPQTSGSGMLKCCDGSLSPSCTCGGRRRGCCSHHGGICSCDQ